MSSDNKPKYVYCVVKSAVLRKKNGEFICSIPFFDRIRIMNDMGNGRLYVEVYKPNGNGYAKYRGFVNSSGFTRHKIINMSGLLYRNITRHEIPTAVRYKGHEDGHIEADDVVSVIASVNGWMLTNKGWTKAKWLKKQKIVEEPEIIKDLLCEVITLAVSDYKRIIGFIKKGKESTREFNDLRAEIRIIRKMLIEGDYNRAISDSATGYDRLMMLDRELGVTDQWIEEVIKN